MHEPAKAWKFSHQISLIAGDPGVTVGPGKLVFRGGAELYRLLANPGSDTLTQFDQTPARADWLAAISPESACEAQVRDYSA